MGKVMEKWWNKRWRLVIVVILLPLLLVPIISVILFPETPLTTALLYGLVFTFFVLWALKILGLIEFWGFRFIVLVHACIVVALLGVLTISVFRISRYVVVGAALFALLLVLFKIWKPRHRSQRLLRV